MPRNAPTDYLLNETETAKALRLSPRTLQWWRHSGGGPAYIKQGARVFYLQEDLLDWIDRNRRDSTSGTSDKDRNGYDSQHVSAKRRV